MQSKLSYDHEFVAGTLVEPQTDPEPEFVVGTLVERPEPQATQSTQETMECVALCASQEEEIFDPKWEEYGKNFISHFCEIGFAPRNAQHICRLEKLDDTSISISWVPNFPLDKRNKFPYPDKLRSMAVRNDTIRLTHVTTAFALLEHIRVGMRSRTVFVTGFPKADVYMIEDEPNIHIGVSGEIGCGKTTVAKYLSFQHGFTEYMLAKPLKDIAVTLGFEHRQVFGDQEEKLEVNEFWGITGREFLQVFGSEVCRDFVPTVLPKMRFNGVTMWVRLFEKFKQDNPERNIVVSDVRFKDESSTLKKYGGVVVRVVRNQNPTQTQTQAQAQTHQSETQTTSICPNVIIHNDRDLQTLYKKLDLLIEFIRKGIVDSNTISLNI